MTKRRVKSQIACCNPSLKLTTKGLQGCGLRRKPGSNMSCSWDYKRVWGNEPSHCQMNSHFGNLSLGGLPNFQRAITGVKTHWIEMFLILLESSWNVDVWSGLAWPIWTIKTQVMAKRRAKSQIRPLKVRNHPDFLTLGGVQHTVGKLSTRGTTLLQTSSQSEVYTQSYGPSKSWESQLWEFWDTHLGVLR
jgi:hypothetical protein